MKTIQFLSDLFLISSKLFIHLQTLNIAIKLGNFLLDIPS